MKGQRGESKAEGMYAKTGEATKEEMKLFPVAGTLSMER